MMLFQQIRSTPTGAYSYLLGDAEQRAALAIDPVDENLDVLLALVGDLGLDLRFILLTHVHPGTGRCAAALRGRTGAGIVASAACGLLAVQRPVEHGEHLVFGDEVIHVIATPGHTQCSVCYRWRDRLFTGDTLLAGSCGDTASPGADAGRLFDSVTGRLFVLPPQTLVFPAFDAQGRTVSTIAEEKATNPLFSGRTRDAFVTQMAELPAASPPCAPRRQFAGRR
jgi:sulfur dioxygenase